MNDPNEDNLIDFMRARARLARAKLEEEERRALQSQYEECRRMLESINRLLDEPQ